MFDIIHTNSPFCWKPTSEIIQLFSIVPLDIINLTSQDIRYPYSVGEHANMKRQFVAMSGFPNVMGTIDCAPIAIRAPYDKEFGKFSK